MRPRRDGRREQADSHAQGWGEALDKFARLLTEESDA